VYTNYHSQTRKALYGLMLVGMFLFMCFCMNGTQEARAREAAIDSNRNSYKKISNNVQSSAFNFPPLKLPFQAGDGVMGWAYLDGDHTGSNTYSFDFVECNGSTNGCNKDTEGIAGQIVIAPTDMTYLSSIPGTGMPNDSKDYHFFEITHDPSKR
jgi:hypothetical protein